MVKQSAHLTNLKSIFYYSIHLGVTYSIHLGVAFCLLEEFNQCYLLFPVCRRGTPPFRGTTQSKVEAPKQRLQTETLRGTRDVEQHQPCPNPRVYQASYLSTIRCMSSSSPPLLDSAAEVQQLCCADVAQKHYFSTNTECHHARLVGSNHFTPTWVVGSPPGVEGHPTP